MPNRGGKTSPEEESDLLLVLAAVDRAERHRAAAGRGASRREIAAHLDLPARSAAERGVQATLERLTARGALTRARRQGVWAWSITTQGRSWLARARRADALPALPEAPQHRAWREARALAAGAVGQLREQLLDDLQEAERLLSRPQPAGSDAWFELAQRLSRDAWRVGSATHCLQEWPEPPEERPDVDDRDDPGDESLPAAERKRRRARRAGRRNVALWND